MRAAELSVTFEGVYMGLLSEPRFLDGLPPYLLLPVMVLPMYNKLSVLYNTAYEQYSSAQYRPFLAQPDVQCSLCTVEPEYRARILKHFEMTVGLKV